MLSLIPFARHSVSPEGKKVWMYLHVYVRTYINYQKVGFFFPTQCVHVHVLYVAALLSIINYSAYMYICVCMYVCTYTHTYMHMYVCMSQALSLITFLVTECVPPMLRKQVALLDPFPDLKHFSGMREKQLELRESLGPITLSQEIDRFLSMGRKCPHSLRTEGLRFLQGTLQLHKQELSELIKENNCGEGPVLQLIQGLAQLCLPYSSQKLCSTTGGGGGGGGEGGGGGGGGMEGGGREGGGREEEEEGGGGGGERSEEKRLLFCEVARCLGEIGATNLHCIALPTSYGGSRHGLFVCVCVCVCV